MSEQPSTSSRWRHDMKNQLGIILGFSELLLGELSPSDSHRPDIEEIHRAALRAMQLLSAETGQEAGKDG